MEKYGKKLKYTIVLGAVFMLGMVVCEGRPVHASSQKTSIAMGKNSGEDYLNNQKKYALNRLIFSKH
ncbi:hypothetical protein [Enterococcus rivorum]|uniref:Uncharacterized protein n=1 Tax=Enterococcus rivorum TaxID=762845 RepID=A0A1E5KWQ9_9ENTE|nr:hypothetical protein [Enterococcus rivorum]MBP2097349.1 hypothetical protein [Enterococcus rivorum]OEH82306.1 hypothetical protein BCR26_02415 [Enterococcus rivorum]